MEEERLVVNSSDVSNRPRFTFVHWFLIAVFSALYLILLCLVIITLEKPLPKTGDSTVAQFFLGASHSFNNNNNNNNNNNKVVSFQDNDSGLIRFGAGTSVYLNISEFRHNQFIKHIDLTSLSSNTFLVSFQDEHSSYVMHGRINDTVVTWGQLTQLPIFVDEIVTLTPTLVVGVGGSSIVVLCVDKEAIIVGAQKQFGDGINSEIASLSPLRFALSFYGPSNSLFTQIGTLKMTNKAAFFDNDDDNNNNNNNNNQLTCDWNVEFSSPILYSPGSLVHDIVALSENTFLLLYLGNSSNPSPMTCRVASVDSNGVVTVGDSSSLDDTNAFFFFGSARLTEERAVVVFVDVTHNQQLIAAVIEVETNDGDSNKKGVFQATLILNQGDSSGELPSGWEFISVDSFTIDKFVVVYSDLADDGRVVLKIVELTEDASLVPASPDFVISSYNTNISKDYYWVSATSLSDTLVVVVDALTANFNPNDPSSTGAKVVLCSTLLPPIGVATNFGNREVSTHQVDVVVAGVATLQTASLVVGKKYYGNTRGELVTGKVSEAYIIASNALLTHDSYVGFAISENKLLLKL